MALGPNPKHGPSAGRWLDAGQKMENSYQEPSLKGPSTDCNVILPETVIKSIHSELQNPAKVYITPRE